MDYNRRLTVLLSHLNAPVQLDSQNYAHVTSGSMKDVNTMTRELVMAWCSKSKINNPEKFPIPDLGTCYAILNEIINQSCALGPCVGWKAGITDVAAYTKLGLKEPFRAPLFRTNIINSPGELSLPSYLHESDIVIEAEFGIKINRDFKPTKEGYTKQEITAGISEIMPSIEVCGGRFVVSPSLGLFQKLSDGGLNMAVVFGKPFLDIPKISSVLKDTKVTLEIEGSVRANGTGANVLGDPLASLTWLVNDLTRSNITLKRGSSIITGAACKCTARKGQTITAKFSGMGDVNVTLI